jgi:anhydro-N-acetylmuramic acid kinase
LPETSDSSSLTFVGLLSGTSADGADCAIVDFSPPRPRLVAFETLPYPADLRVRILDLASSNYRSHDVLDLLGSLDAELGEFFGRTILRVLSGSGVAPERISAIGSHGQTVRHRPQGAHPFTIQIGDPNRIAAYSGILTVADFRRMDMAYGGGGAPLVPSFWNECLEPDSPAARSKTVILNLGGIANLTFLPPLVPEVMGFDTGPANTLLDGWVFEQTGQPYDQDGFFSRQGRVIPELLEDLTRDDYFGRPPPKSTGPEYFSRDWLQSRLHRHTHAAASDIARTLIALTAVTVTQAVIAQAPAGSRLLVSGGGLKHPLLLEEIRHRLPGWMVTTTQAVGFDPDALEAMAFAWLAWKRLSHEPASLPSVTGARKSAVLGGIYRPTPP